MMNVILECETEIGRCDYERTQEGCRCARPDYATVFAHSLASLNGSKGMLKIEQHCYLRHGAEIPDQPWVRPEIILEPAPESKEDMAKFVTELHDQFVRRVRAKIPALGLLADDVLKKEMAFYLTAQKQSGLPLDNRNQYPKSDWTRRTPGLTGKRADFDAIIPPAYDCLNTTPDRSPMTDWYQTHNARRVGFTARPVVGGLVLRALYDADIWKKYASRDKAKTATWAPFPVQDTDKK